ncbi:MAG: IS21 family transposase, partial [Euryarchaeota archaeon]|nr:IS21 family transposase [Euryarchaeota archaeon]
EMLRLSEQELSLRSIEKIVNVSRPIITEYLKQLKSAGLNYQTIKDLSDDDVEDLLNCRNKKKSGRYQDLAEQFEYISCELKRIGVTLFLLWEEYRQKYPAGYSYSQFCFHYQIWCEKTDISMHQHYKAGDKMFVDFTGKKMSYYDPVLRESQEVDVFVALLSGSQYTYVEASPSQTKEDWIKVNDNSLRFFGGVPNCIVPDNLKSGVIAPCFYEPELNQTYADFAEHYDTVILPTRPKKPKDKPLVENAVRNVYRWIYAPLRNITFFSLEDLNHAIWNKLDEYNERNFQKLQTSRRKLFEEIEKDVLKPLPEKNYELRYFRNVKVQFNYHVELKEDQNYYSVPFQFAHEEVRLRFTSSIVEIYHKNTRIAFHKRVRKKGEYTTLKHHLPPHHRFYAEWSPDRMLRWGAAIGTNVHQMIKAVLESRKYPEQAFRACLGILNLAKKYGDNRLDRACGRALQFNAISFKMVSYILKNGLDKTDENSGKQKSFPHHENLRGGEYYKKEN